MLRTGITCFRPPSTGTSRLASLAHVAILIMLPITAMCWFGCTTVEDDIQRLGGRAEPYQDSYYVRATFLFATDDTLRSVANMDVIVVLDLTGSLISDEGLECLSAMESLNVLVLTNTRVTDRGMKYLKEIGRGKADHPLELTLDKTALTDEGIHILAAMRNLASLSLKCTQITDASLRYLQEADSLRSLDLDKTRITDSGLALLAGMRLSWLSLRDTRVSDNGLKRLHPIKTLQQIDVTGTQVTPEGIKELEKAIPRIEVEYRCQADRQRKR